MSDLMLGTIIGGIIGLVPSVLSIIQTIYVTRSNRLLQLEMKRIELFYTNKRDALEQLMVCLGQICYPAHRQTCDQDYFAAAKRASVFVSKETADGIEAVNRLLNDIFCGRSGPVPFNEDPSVLALNNLIRVELECCSIGRKQPSKVKRAHYDAKN